MKANKHPEYNIESERLKKTQEEIDNFVVTTASQGGQSGVDAWSTAALRHHNISRGEDYKKHRQEPYFGRLDFHAKTSKIADIFYIGYRALNLGKYEVVDWRAPIGSLFASSSAEEQDYKAPGGKIKGRLQLRRRFKMLNGELTEITDEFDYRPTPKENLNETKKFEKIPKPQESQQDFLLSELYSRGDPRLQDIVKTIQKQQDEIIRSRFDQIMVINGVAGSGKTSMAIHRMAYLLYPGNNTKIRATQSIIFCPNPIFLHYIEDLLPSLGERNVQQTTFYEWALQQMTLSRVKLTDTTHEFFVATDSDPATIKIRWQRAKLKGSLKFTKVLEKYLDYLRQFGQNYPETPFTFREIGPLSLTFKISHQEIIKVIEDAVKQTYLTLDQIRSSAWMEITELIKKRYDEIVFEQSKAIKAAAEAEVIKLEDLLQLESDEKAAKEIVAKIRAKKNEESGYRVRAFRNEVKKQHVFMVESLMKKEFDRIWPVYQAAEIYYDLLNQRFLLQEMTRGLLPGEEVAALFEKHIDRSMIEMEDVAAILYLHQLIYGEGQQMFDHIVIDEVQDFSPLQLKLIGDRSSNKSMTLVGDIAQGIYEYRGINSWRDIEEAFPFEVIRLEKVSQSYRSTIELVEFGNEILKQISKKSPLLGIPYSRHGAKPLILRTDTQELMDKELISRIKIQIKNKYKNIAIIVKNNELLEHVLSVVRNSGIPVNTTTSQLDNHFKYTGGVVVLPVTLTKGMEFESVFLYDVNEATYDSQKIYDGRLLYVAVTRALHELTIFYTGELSGYLRFFTNAS